MKITLLTDDSIRLEPIPGQLTIEAPSARHSYSPFQMLGSALAMCIFSILQSWASNAKISTDDLVIDVSWTFAEKPHRVGAMEVSFTWPSLPVARREAARRVAALCPVHTTLHHTPDVSIRAVA